VGISHIFFNLLVFYWFAKLFVEYLGSDKLIAVYILGGLSGGALYLLLYNTVPFFIQQPSLLVGSSAAVYAVVTAAATLLPEYTFFLLFIGPIRIKYIAAFYIVQMPVATLPILVEH
jgi:membrane associated rhomboid family serine protease